jgi:hypothetical protein
MPVKLNSSGGGSVTLTTPSTASDFTVTVPAVTGTLVTSNGASTIEFAAGTVSAPSITTTGDTNTGIYFPAADTIAFTEGGVEAMRINSSGNVGIGTTSPGARLDVVSDASALGLNIRGRAADSIGALRFANNANSSELARLQADSSSNLLFTTGASATERARINSSGYVSIGSTTTNGLLTVDGVGPTLVSQAFAFFAESGGAAVSGYASGQNPTNSIWASSRISGQEFNARSDGRLKKDVTPIPASDAWHFVQNVMPVHYKWINGPDNGHKFGFIAQDVVKAGFPNLIGQYSDSNVQEITDADGFTSPAGIALTVNYDQIIPVLAVTIKELKAEVDALKARIATLEAK